MASARATAAGGRAPSVLVPRPRGREKEVLEAAAEVFARRGYAAATVQDVADALGILKGSVYYYIKTKEDLLYRIMVEVHEAADALHAEVAASELAPFDQLLLYVRLQLAWNVRNLIKISVYYNDMGQLSRERLKDVRERAKAHERFIVELIAEAQRAGTVIGDVDPVLLANHVFAVVIWPYRWFRRGGRTSVDTLISTCEEFVHNALSVART